MRTKHVLYAFMVLFGLSEAFGQDQSPTVKYEGPMFSVEYPSTWKALQGFPSSAQQDMLNLQFAGSDSGNADPSRNPGFLSIQVFADRGEMFRFYTSNAGWRRNLSR